MRKGTIDGWKEGGRAVWWMEEIREKSIDVERR